MCMWFVLRLINSERACGRHQFQVEMNPMEPSRGRQFVVVPAIKKKLDLD